MLYRSLTISVVLIAVLWSLGAAQINAQTEENFDLDDRMRLVHYVDPYGLVTWFEYDALDRPYEIRSLMGRARFGYDAAGRHAWTQDNVGLVQYDYDAADRLAGVRYEVVEKGKRVFTEAVRYTYDDHGQVRAVALVREGQRTPYVVELFRNLKGQIVKARIDGHLVRYRQKSTAGGTTTTRTLPDGTRTILRRTSLGLPRSIEHYQPKLQSSYHSTAFQYELAKGQMVVNEHIGSHSHTNTFDLVHPSSETSGPRRGIDISYNADGRLLKQRIDGKQRWFINAPIGRQSGLVVELNGRGRPERAFFSTPNLSVEQRFGQPPTFFLENARTPTTAPVHLRIVDGRSMANQISGDDVRLLAPHAAIFPKQLSQLVPPVDYTKKALGLVNAVADLRATYNQPNMDLSKIKLKLDAFNLGVSILNDAADIANSQVSLGQKLWLYGALGHTAEHLGKEASKRFFEQSVGKGIGGEIVGLGFDVMRGRSLLSPESVEHYLDMGVGLAAGGLVTALGQPQLVPAAMELGTKLPDMPRQLLAEDAKRAGALVGRTGEDQTGQFIYQASNALLRGDVSKFQQAQGDIFNTVIAGRKRHRSAFVTRRNRSYEDFQHAVLDGDRHTVSQMLQQDHHVRRAMMRAGYSGKSIAQMSEALRADRTPRSLPGDRITEVQARLGGIDLTTPETSFPMLGRIEGAIFDPNTQRLVLVGDGDKRLPSLSPDLLAVALLAAFSPGISEPKFSLDPVDPNNPSSWQKAVYIPQNLLRGTRAGQLMYSGDLDLKLLAFGSAISYGPWATIPEGGTQIRGPVEVWLANRYQSIHLGPRAPLWPGFTSLTELTEQAGDDGQGKSVRSRQWIVVKEVTLKEAPNAFVFEKVKMGVNARRQEVSSTGELVDVDTDDPLSTTFARQMTKNFDKVAELIPSFHKIRELAKAVALAKWLAQNNIKVDLTWAAELVNRRVDSVREVSTLHWHHERTSQTPFRKGNRVGIRTAKRRVHVSGGVDLSVTAKTKPDRKRVPALRKAVLASLAQADEPTFEVPFEGRLLTSAVLPLNDAGRRTWGNHRHWVHDHIEYSVDGKGRISSGRDVLGQHETYKWTDNGQLRSIIRTAPNDWLTEVTFDGTQRVKAWTTPSGQRIQWQESPNGMTELWLDGELEMTVKEKKRGKNRLLTLTYPRLGVVRKLELDRTGRIVAVHRTIKDHDLPPETVRLDEVSQNSPWQLKGRTLELVGPSKAKISTRKLKRGELTVTVELHGLKIDLTYDATNRLVQANLAPFPSVRLNFDAETGLGQASIGRTGLRVKRLPDGLTRITIQRPRG